MFNFRSLAEVVGVSLEGENAGRRLSLIEAERRAKESGEIESQEGVSPSEVKPAEADVAGVGGDEPSQAGILESPPAGTTTKHDVKTDWEGTKVDDQQSTLGVSDSLLPPTVTITPDTPTAAGADDESKQLGCATTLESVPRSTP